MLVRRIRGFLPDYSDFPHFVNQIQFSADDIRRVLPNVFLLMRKNCLDIELSSSLAEFAKATTMGNVNSYFSKTEAIPHFLKEGRGDYGNDIGGAKVNPKATIMYRSNRDGSQWRPDQHNLIVDITDIINDCLYVCYLFDGQITKGPEGSLTHPITAYDCGHMLGCDVLEHGTEDKPGKLFVPTTKLYMPTPCTLRGTEWYKRTPADLLEEENLVNKTRVEIMKKKKQVLVAY